MTQAIGMAPGLSSLVMYIGSSDGALFNAMATANPLNAQLSFSWVWFPADQDAEQSILLEFAAQGQNVFHGGWRAGKRGHPQTGYCYPSDDPYVTSVGGTDFNNGERRVAPGLLKQLGLTAAGAFRRRSFRFPLGK